MMGVGRVLSGAHCNETQPVRAGFPPSRFLGAGIWGGGDSSTHPLHPGVLQDLGRTEPLLGISHQQLGNEVFGSEGDVRPVLVGKLVLPLLDALEEHVLGWAGERNKKG